MIGPDGTPRGRARRSTVPFLHTPMGVATDAGGNVWIANQGVPPPTARTSAFGVGVPSLAPPGARRDPRRPARRSPAGASDCRGAIAVDGNGNVWAANFAGQRASSSPGFPLSTRVRDPDPDTPSPPDVTGYGFDGLTRNTGVAIDPSGNVWLMNNWIQDPLVPNPGGHEVVAFVGMAGPVQPSAPRPRPDTAPARVLITPKFTGEGPTYSWRGRARQGADDVGFERGDDGLDVGAVPHRVVVTRYLDHVEPAAELRCP